MVLRGKGGGSLMFCNISKLYLQYIGRTFHQKLSSIQIATNRAPPKLINMLSTLVKHGQLFTRSLAAFKWGNIEHHTYYSICFVLL